MSTTQGGISSLETGQDTIVPPSEAVMRRVVVLVSVALLAGGIVSGAQEGESNSLEEPRFTLSLVAPNEMTSQPLVADQVQFSSDGEYLMVERAGLMTLWNLETGHLETQFRRGDLRESETLFGRPRARMRVTFENGLLAYHAKKDDTTLLRSWSKHAGFDTLYGNLSADGELEFSDIVQSGDGSRVAWMASNGYITRQRVDQFTGRGFEVVESGYWNPFPDSLVRPAGVSGVRLDASGARMLRHFVDCSDNPPMFAVVELVDLQSGDVVWRRADGDFRYSLGFTADGTGVVIANLASLAEVCKKPYYTPDVDVGRDGTHASVVVVDTASGDSRFRLSGTPNPPLGHPVNLLPCESDAGVQGFLRVDLLKSEEGDGLNRREEKFRLERFSSRDGTALDSGHLVEEYGLTLGLECDRTGDWWLLSAETIFGDPYSILWDLKTGKSARLPGRRIDPPDSKHFSFSADGRLLASADDDGR